MRDPHWSSRHSTGSRNWDYDTPAQLLSDMDQILPWPGLVTVSEYLRRNGIKIVNGTIVDAAIVNTPSSTKRKAEERAARE